MQGDAAGCKNLWQRCKRIPLGDCTAIFFSGPGITMILSLFILRSHMLNQPNAVDDEETKTSWIFHTFQACQAWWCKILRNENLNNSGFNNSLSSNILNLGSTVAFGEFSLQPALLLGWVFPKQKILAFLHFVSEIFFSTQVVIVCRPPGLFTGNSLPDGA